MNQMHRWQYILFLAFGIFAIVTACKNTDAPGPVTTVSGISATSAPVGTPLTITGTNFSSTPASNTVTFGGVAATVTGASPTSLTVTVPSGAGNPIVVIANGQTATFSGQFVLGTKPVIEVVGSITANTTWTPTNNYLIRGNVFVRPGVVLTIQPGTIIKGATRDRDPAGQGRGGTLIVLQGARIEANGTAQQPIVFTSSKPAGQRNYGDWGGIVLVGKAPHNRIAAQQIEGNVDVQLGAFNEPADNSGTLRYVRIEFPGIALTNAANSEINGLTLYGVGSGTTIEYVQVSYSGDDSFEWFGGTVNGRYLVALRGYDDDFDTDWGFSGKVQFALAMRDTLIADQSRSNSFESDNFDPGEPATGANNGLPLTQPVFANVTSLAFRGTPRNASTASTGGSGSYQAAMHLRRNTAISIYNSVFAGWPEGLRLDGTATGTLANVNAGRLDLQGITLANVGIPNTTTAVVGAGSGITNQLAQDFFNAATRKNNIVASTDVAALFNTTAFTLTNPGLLPPANSPLLVAGNAVTGGKLADSFFQAAPYRGAFGTTNWTASWTNFDPQNTNYDR